MSGLLYRVKIRLLKGFLNTPLINRYSKRWHKGLGVVGNNYRISSKITIVGSYANIELGENAEINTGCFLLSKEKIIIGENSTLAYQATILTSANPNGPHNKLAKIYKKISKPVVIGHDCWIGARATILPGVVIGNYCVIAAGSIVTKDVADYTVVGGVPARPLKTLDKNILR